MSEKRTKMDRRQFIKTAALAGGAAVAGFPTIVLWDVTGGDASLRAGDASVLANASAGRPTRRPAATDRP